MRQNGAFRAYGQLADFFCGEDREGLGVHLQAQLRIQMGEMDCRLGGKGGDGCLQALPTPSPPGLLRVRFLGGGRF